jgi:hypothetical protein
MEGRDSGRAGVFIALVGLAVPLLKRRGQYTASRKEKVESRK